MGFSLNKKDSSLAENEGTERKRKSSSFFWFLVSFVDCYFFISTKENDIYIYIK